MTTNELIEALEKYCEQEDTLITLWRGGKKTLEINVADVLVLLNNAQQIANQLEAYEKFAEEVKGMDVWQTYVKGIEHPHQDTIDVLNDAWRLKRDQLLNTLNKALKE